MSIKNLRIYLDKVIRRFDEYDSENINDIVPTILQLSQSLPNDLIGRKLQKILSIFKLTIIGELSSHSKSQLLVCLELCFDIIKAYEVVDECSQIITSEENEDQPKDESLETLDQAYESTFQVFEDLAEPYSATKIAIYPMLANSCKKNQDPFRNRELLAAINNRLKELMKMTDAFYQSMRVRLSEDVEGFVDLKQCQAKELRRQLKTQEKFFDLARSQNRNTHLLAGLFKSNRTSPPAAMQKIDTTGLSARALITAEAAVIDRPLLLTQAEIDAKIGWHHKPSASGKTNLYNMEKVTRGQTDINSRIRPVPGQLNNCILSGVGSYGNYKPRDILAVIDNVTPTYADERRLAKLMILYSKNGQAFTQKDLKDAGLKATPLLVDKINRICYLTSIKEISRRLPKGFLKDATGQSYVIESVPYALAHARALQLLAAGHLTMAEVFGNDAPFGLPTGSNLNNPREIIRLKAKLEKINSKYNQLIVQPEEPRNVQRFLQQYPHAGITRFRQAIRDQELGEIYGGDNDTDSEYASSDEDTQNYPTL